MTRTTLCSLAALVALSFAPQAQPSDGTPTMLRLRSGAIQWGEVLEHTTKRATRAPTNQVGLAHSFVTAVNKDTFTVQPGGMSELVEVDRTKVKRSRGAGVLIPGPLKDVQRCGLVKL